MDTTTFSTALTRFVQHVSQEGGMTIKDIRLEIRNERLTELSDWSNQDLDAIEVHAAKLADDAPLDEVLTLPFDYDPVSCAAAVSSICSPSPFAWT